MHVDFSFIAWFLGGHWIMVKPLLNVNHHCVTHGWCFVGIHLTLIVYSSLAAYIWRTFWNARLRPRNWHGWDFELDIRDRCDVLSAYLCIICSSFRFDNTCCCTCLPMWIWLKMCCISRTPANGFGRKQLCFQ